MNRLLKARIVEKFGSQFEFARIIGEHEAIVSRVIRGHRELSENELRKWADALGCDDLESLFHDHRR